MPHTSELVLKIMLYPCIHAWILYLSIVIWIDLVESQQGDRQPVLLHAVAVISQASLSRTSLACETIVAETIVADAFAARCQARMQQVQEQ